MALIPFVEKVVQFRTESGVVVRASRPYLDIELVDQEGTPLRMLAIYDSAAPFSVLPYSLWHDRNIPWQPLGTQLLRGDQPDPASLTWLGTACQLGEVKIRLVHRAAQVHSGLLRLVVKLPLAKVPSFMEKEAILGQSFMIDNPVTLALRGGSGKWEGVALLD